MSLVGLAVLFPELPLLVDDIGVVAFCLIDGVVDSTISYFNGPLFPYVAAKL